MEQPGDGYQIAGTWELRRAGDNRVFHVDFDGLDDMRTLPVTESYACRVRNRGASLYFRRARSRDLWEGELAAFVSSIEA